jgi:hypothetical protein
MLFAMAPPDAQLAAVKALAAQAGAGPAERQSLIASGAVVTLLKHLSSKTAAVASQSALALSLLASDPSTRPSVWAHSPTLVPALVQALKTGGPLTLARTLATLAALVEHVPDAGAAVIAANGVVPILHLAQKSGSDAPSDAAVSALDAFAVQKIWRKRSNATQRTEVALKRAHDLVEPLACGLSVGPPRAQLFCLRALRIMSMQGDRRVVEVLRRPTLTDSLVGFAMGEDAGIAVAALETLLTTLTIGCEPFCGPMGPKDASFQDVGPEDAAYRASPKLRQLWQSLPGRLRSPHPALVVTALMYVNGISNTPGVQQSPWFRQCVRDAPRFLQSPVHEVKLWGLSLVGRQRLGRYAKPRSPPHPRIVYSPTPPHAHACTRAHTAVCVCQSVHACVCVCLSVRVFVSVRACMRARGCVCVCSHA